MDNLTRLDRYARKIAFALYIGNFQRAEQMAAKAVKFLKDLHPSEREALKQRIKNEWEL